MLEARRTELTTEIAKAITTNGGTALPVPMDVTNSAPVGEAFGRAEDHFGVVDTLIGIAGNSRFGR